MSRHLRRIARMDSGRKNRVVPESAWPGGLVSVELHANVARFTAAVAAVVQGIKRASDIDHAVAIEREAIAVWLESLAADERRHAGTAPTRRMKQACRDEARACERAAHAIRQGAHNANTPPNAQKRG